MKIIKVISNLDLPVYRLKIFWNKLTKSEKLDYMRMLDYAFKNK